MESSSHTETLSGTYSMDMHYTSINNWMIVRLSSDSTVVGSGFNAEWRTGRFLAALHDKLMIQFQSIL